MVVSVGSRVSREEGLLGMGDGKEIMGTLDTLEVREEKLRFPENLLWTGLGPWIRCAICIQLKSYSHSKRGGVRTLSHKETAEV